MATIDEGMTTPHDHEATVISNLREIHYATTSSLFDCRHIETQVQGAKLK
jgi:hypothetical protein